MQIRTYAAAVFTGIVCWRLNACSLNCLPILFASRLSSALVPALASAVGLFAAMDFCLLFFVNALFIWIRLSLGSLAFVNENRFCKLSSFSEHLLGQLADLYNNNRANLKWHASEV